MFRTFSLLLWKLLPTGPSELARKHHWIKRKKLEVFQDIEINVVLIYFKVEGQKDKGKEDATEIINQGEHWDFVHCNGKEKGQDINLIYRLKKAREV